MTLVKTNHRSLVSLNLPTAVGLLITFAQGVVRAMTGNPQFPTPTPALAVVIQAIADLQAAETAALARTKGAVAARNEKKNVLIKLLQQLKAYVQDVADADVEQGASIIQGASLAVRKAPVHPPRVFAARPGNVSGSAILVAASAGNRSAFEWEYSNEEPLTTLQLDDEAEPLVLRIVA